MVLQHWYYTHFALRYIKPDFHRSAVQKQTHVTAYFSSEQLLLFAVAAYNCCGNKKTKCIMLN